MSSMLVGAAAAFGVGLLLGDQVGACLPLWIWPLGSASTLLMGLLLRRWPAVRRGALLAAVILLGVLRVSSDRPFPDWLLLRTPDLQQLEGTVVSYPSFGASSVTFTFQPDVLPGRLRVAWYHDDPPLGLVHYGERLGISGRAELPEPFDGFDYPGYLARQSIFATMNVDADGLSIVAVAKGSVFRWGDRLRQTILERFDRWMGPDGSAMARSLLFGDRGALPDEIEDAFSRTGLMHLLAVSGLHLGIFLGGAWWIVRRLGLRPRWAYPLVGGLVLLALWVVGPRVSLVRAGLLFAFLALGSVLADLGWILRRSIRTMNGLAAAAIAVLALRPGALYDAGFQLTFAATASILVLFGQPFDWHRRIAALTEPLGCLRVPLRTALTLAAVAVAAQAGAAPVVAWHFGSIHPLAIVANVIVVPLAGLALWCGFAAIVLSGTALAGVAIVPFSAVLTGLRVVVVWFSRVPLTQLEVPGWMGIWLGGLVLFAIAAGAYLSDRSS